MPEIFELNKKRLNKVDLNKRVRVDISPEFPLRGLVTDDDCKGHLTATWFSNGKGKKYRKYVCRTPGCPNFGKTFSAEEVEERFENVLRQSVLKNEVGILVKKMFGKVWEEEVAIREKKQKAFEIQKRALEQKLSGLTDLILTTKSLVIKRTYEKQMEEAASEVEKIEAVLIEEIDLSIPYQTALDKVILLLKEPYKAWKKLNVYEQHALFFFLFQEKIPYNRKTGYQTSQIPYAVRLFEDFAEANSPLVEMPGVKPGSRTFNFPIVHKLSHLKRL